MGNSEETINPIAIMFLNCGKKPEYQEKSSPPHTQWQHATS